MARLLQCGTTMLPPSKRSPRSHEPSEVIRTGDYEVVHASSSGRKAQTQRPSERPRVYSPSMDDEDKTTLFAGSIRQMIPPKPQTAVQTNVAKAPKTPNMNLRGLVRETRQHTEKPPSPEALRGSVRPRADTEDRTILRPTSDLPLALQKTVAAAAVPAPPQPAQRPPSARPPAMMPTPYMPMKPIAAAGQSAPPVTLNAPGGSDRKSDPPGDPPSSVITAKTRIIRAKSSMSWAAGLMALGAVVGLVTAVVARGDADSVLDATARLMDPSHAPAAAQANAAVAQAAVLPSFVETGKHVAPLGTDQNPAPGACTDTPSSPTLTVSAPVINTPPAATHAPETKTASIAGAEPAAAAKPAPPKPAPVAWAAPARVAPKAAPPPAAPQQASTSGGWLANVTPPNAGAPIARPSKAAAKGGSEFESAAAADALAKAQLEASLR